jgi:cbb3-type cytochrome oxidase subunit 3
MYGVMAAVILVCLIGTVYFAISTEKSLDRAARANAETMRLLDQTEKSLAKSRYYQNQLDELLKERR